MSEQKSRKNAEKLERKYERSFAKEMGQPRQRKEARKPTELKNQSAVTVDTRAEQALGLHKRGRDEPSELVAGGQLVPARENQSLETLGVRAQRTGEVPQPLYDQLLQSNRRRHEQQQRVFPMEELVRQGLLSTQLLSLDQRQDALARQCRVDTDFIAAQLRQLHRPGGQRLLGQSTEGGGATAPLQSKNKKRKTEEAPAISSQVKLTIGFGTHDHTFAYERRRPNEKREHTFQLYDAANARLEEEFFVHDVLESETPFQVRATRTKMMRQLTEENWARYHASEQVPRLAPALVPRGPFEVVAREYLEQYRHRPPVGAQLCFNGARCLFYTFSLDPNVRYVGRAFFTERQCQQLKRGESLDANEDGLCLDCLLLDWTRRHERNITRQHTPQTYYNHFGVQVGPGQYCADAMLEPVFNGRETGIFGLVPRYDAKKRQVSFVARRVLCQGQAPQTMVEAYVAETGLDF